jgi:hypothetical protein
MKLMQTEPEAKFFHLSIMFKPWGVHAKMQTVAEVQGFWMLYQRSQAIKTSLGRANTLIRILDK